MFDFKDLWHSFLDRKWVVATAGYPNPEPRTFPSAFLGSIVEGGEIVFIR